MQRSRVSCSATPFVPGPRLCAGNTRPAIAIKWSGCPTIMPFRGVTCCSTWEPALGEDKISPVYSGFSPDHPQSIIKLELTVWLMTHSSSQRTSSLCRAIKKTPLQSEFKKMPPPHLTSKQIRQELGFLTRAQTSMIR